VLEFLHHISNVQSRITPLPTTLLASAFLISSCFLAACAKQAHGKPSASRQNTAPAVSLNMLPGMPPNLDPHDIYAADRPGNLSPVVKNDPPRIYVPNTKSNSVMVIDPKTYRVIDQFRTGRQPQHVVPSYDLKTLWVLDDKGNSLIKIDPATGKPGAKIRVRDPYNMYYTPDGKYAIVVAEQRRHLNFLDASTLKLHYSLPIHCRGVDHIDFSADGRYFLATCEFSGEVIKVDVAKEQLLGHLALDRGGMPQDIKLSPDGTVFYVADMKANGVYLLDGDHLQRIGFIPTGKGAHGLYVSRDSRDLYVTNRGEGSISLIDFASRKVIEKWQLPGKASPDMGGVSADGKVLWLSGRYNSEVYAIDTQDGKLLARIPVGRGPHGLCVFPQPGRYSLGHTGILR
jgi:YVTN family beta-propeller protein